MKPNYSPQPTSQDHALLRSTLLRLTATKKMLCVVVVVLVALLWYDLLNRLMAFGRGIDYSGLHALGVQTVALLQQYNPFFWWAVVALCTLIIAYFLYSFVDNSLKRVRLKLVDEDTVGALASQLSEPAREVLRWAWRDRREPITVGDLQRAAHEMRHGRAAKISLVRRHAALLDMSDIVAPEPVHTIAVSPADAPSIDIRRPVGETIVNAPDAHEYHAETVNLAKVDASPSDTPAEPPLATPGAAVNTASDDASPTPATRARRQIDLQS
jgi:hypothetical protein